MINIDPDSVEGVVVGVANGPLTLEEMCDAAVSMWQCVAAPPIRILWDLRDARFNLSTSEVRELAEFVKRHSPPGDLRTAFVVTEDLEYGLVRMFEVFRETDRAGVAVFRGKEQALEWLASDAGGKVASE